MPGYEPFLLCDFHVHTRWSDGRLSLTEVEIQTLSAEPAEAAAIVVKVRPPRPHSPTEEELLAHASFLSTVTDPIWNRL